MGEKVFIHVRITVLIMGRSMCTYFHHPASVDSDQSRLWRNGSRFGQTQTLLLHTYSQSKGFHSLKQRESNYMLLYGEIIITLENLIEC